MAGRARAPSRAAPPTGRIAVLAATLLIAYLVLSGTALSSQISLATDHTSPTPTAPLSPATDLAIAKTDSPDPVAIGGVLAYTVTVNNIGAIPAEDVFVTDTLPDHVSLISSTPGRGSCDGTMCALGGIAAGDSAVISYVALVTEGAESPIVNVVCAITRTVETDLTHNCDDEETRLKTSLDATSTPNGIPPMGGNPLDGGESAGLSLLLVLGIGLVVIGAVAGLVAGRRPANRR